ncbi:MAG: hypothetical protein ACREBU_11920, partial [Nitrososphaera sp.]
LGPASPFFVGYYRKGTSPSPFYTPFDGTSKVTYSLQMLWVLELRVPVDLEHYFLCSRKALRTMTELAIGQ